MLRELPLLMLFALLVGVHVVTEISWRIGHERGVKSERKVPVEPASALLAVLGLLLAFTVSMAVARFDSRQALVIREANAIGTAQLRSRFLSEPAGKESRALLDAYLGKRVLWGEQSVTSADLERLWREGAAYQTKLWEIAVQASTSTPPTTFAAYQESLNQMMDIASERAYVRANRIPGTVLVLLAVMVLIANGLFAGVMGRNGKSRTLDLHLMAFATWLVIGLIADLDRPRRGLVQVSQEPLVQLQEYWRGEATKP